MCGYRRWGSFRAISEAVSHSRLDQGWVARTASFTCLAIENLVGLGHLNRDGSSLLHHCSMWSLIVQQYNPGFST